MRIHVHALTGWKDDIDFDDPKEEGSPNYVLKMKEAIAEKKGLSVGSIRLIHAGDELLNNWSYKMIQEMTKGKEKFQYGSTVHLVTLSWSDRFLSFFASKKEVSEAAPAPGPAKAVTTPTDRDTVNLYIKTLTGKTYPYQLETRESMGERRVHDKNFIRDMKKAIAEQYDLEAKSIRLITSGIGLADELSRNEAEVLIGCPLTSINALHLVIDTQSLTDSVVGGFSAFFSSKEDATKAAPTPALDEEQNPNTATIN